MTRSLNCKDVVDPACTHIIYGETEEELSQNVKKHGIQAHGYTEHTWKKQVSKNGDHVRRTSKKQKKAKHPGPRQKKGKTKNRR